MLLLILLRAGVACTALAAMVAALDPDDDVVMPPKGDRAGAQHLIDATSSDVFHLDLRARGGQSAGSEGGQSSGVPWFDGFRGNVLRSTAATVSHPIRRMFWHLREERVGIEEAMSWRDGEGTS